MPRKTPDSPISTFSRRLLRVVLCIHASFSFNDAACRSSFSEAATADENPY
ncbi:MAG: hypothetical protein OEV48_11430 [Acidobacteriota bacterium]|nr:hypothetical protein [Acidobacteriota bacterium]